MINVVVTDFPPSPPPPQWPNPTCHSSGSYRKAVGIKLQVGYHGKTGCGYGKGLLGQAFRHSPGGWSLAKHSSQSGELFWHRCRFYAQSCSHASRKVLERWGEVISFIGPTSAGERDKLAP